MLFAQISTGSEQTFTSGSVRLDPEVFTLAMGTGELFGPGSVQFDGE